MYACKLYLIERMPGINSRHKASQSFIKDTTHLRRNVFRGPELRVEPLVWCELACEAEVGELERAGLAHEEVLC